MPGWSRALGVLGGVLFAWAARAGPCEEASRVADVAAAVERAETAYRRREVATVQAATERALGLLGCLDEVLPRTTIAGLHRARAYVAYDLGDTAEARRELWSARASDPSTPPPPGDPTRRVWDELADVELHRDLPAPLRGSLLVGGVPGTTAPTQRPWVLQRLDLAGEVEQTALVEFQGPLPPYPRVGFDPDARPEPRFTASFVGGVLVYPRYARGAVLAGPSVIGTVRLWERLSLELALHSGFSEIGRDRWVWLPVVRLGPRVHYDFGSARAWASVVGTATHQQLSGLEVGGGGAVGARFGFVYGVSVDVEVMAAWAGFPLMTAGTGVGLSW